MSGRYHRLGLILAGFGLLNACAGGAGQALVNLALLTVPSSGAPGVTTFSVFVSGFPSGTILPGNVTVTLTPASDPPTVTTTAIDVTTLANGTLRVTFQIPPTLMVSSPTLYQVSISGTTTTGTSFASANTSSLTVTPPASIVSVTPITGLTGQSVSAVITGQFTHFAQGATQASFGTGITVGSGPEGGFGPVTVNSPTTTAAQISIDPSAATGSRTVVVQTGNEQESLASGFTVQPGAPVLVSVSPNTGQQSRLNLSVTIAAERTHFVQGTTQASFGAGITVGGGAAGGFGPVTVNSPTTTAAQISIDPSAATGSRTVVVQTGTEQESLASGFTVLSGTPVILSVSPNTGRQGQQNLLVTITGQFTNFAQGTTQASFGPGTSVGGGLAGGFGLVTVNSPTSAVAQLAIDAVATAGARTVSVQTGIEQESSASGFLVTVATPVVTITDPPALALFNKGPITVKGTVDNSSDTVVVNGVAAPVSNGSWTAVNVPLREGTNILTASATDPAGNVGTATESVTLDTTPPTVRILTPSNNAALTSSTVTVAGNINDIVSGTVNPKQATVVVNGIPAFVANRSFVAADVPLVQGQNTITAVATDAAGNQSQDQLHVNFVAAAPVQRLVMISGNNQSGVIGTTLPVPLTVQAVGSNGAPIANRQVTFTVTKSDGVLTSLSQQGQQVTVLTDNNGQASVQFQLGTRLGVGNNEVSAASPGFVGEIVFCASATVGPPAKILVVGLMPSADHQIGVIGQALPAPFVVIVVDSGGNPVAGVPVTFTVTEGGGNLGGSPSTTVTTDDDGKAGAVLTLGQEEGIDNYKVLASFPGLTGSPAVFSASGVAAGPATNTSVSGVVLDNANTPIPNATAKIEGTNLSAVTDAQGKFSISGVPVGTITLLVDGSTSTRPETFPFLAFQMTTIAGQANTVGMPILLPPLDTANAQTVGGDQDVVLKMAGVPGYEFTVFAHSVTKADGTPYVGPMTLSQVHSDRVPMIPPNGTAPNIAGTLQPAGLHFNPPIRTQFPNTTGLAPGMVVDVFSFDHDLGTWASQGPGRASADGSVIVSDPGFGITKSGWHFAPPPPPPPNCTISCDDHNVCTADSVMNPPCVCRNVPSNEGGICGGLAEPGPNSCVIGICQGGSCMGTPKADGESCDDGLFCTDNDKCTGGACMGTKKPDVTLATLTLSPDSLGIKLGALSTSINIFKLLGINIDANVSGQVTLATVQKCCEAQQADRINRTGTGSLSASVSGDVPVPGLGFSCCLGTVEFGVFLGASGNLSGNVGVQEDKCANAVNWSGSVSASANGTVTAKATAGPILSVSVSGTTGITGTGTVQGATLTLAATWNGIKVNGSVQLISLVKFSVSQTLVNPEQLATLTFPLVNP